MTPPRSRCTLEPTRIATGSDDENGVIVRIGGRIAAIFVKLEAPYHEIGRAHV